MDNPVFDYTTAKIVREMREQAHLLNAWMNPNVSREAEILNECADRLENLSKVSTRPLSEFDRLMK